MLPSLVQGTTSKLGAPRVQVTVRLNFFGSRGSSRLSLTPRRQRPPSVRRLRVRVTQCWLQSQNQSQRHHPHARRWHKRRRTRSSRRGGSMKTLFARISSNSTVSDG